MRPCSRCGAENGDEARFCSSCGAPLAAEAPERRKLATMLFCDMSGSTAMGERVDAESVRELMFAYFHEMRAAIERHGGTVEKFIGDAVVAVFGVPVAHEDDALRAVRAAWEMQERLGGLNDELERRFGSTIALRIGVNTGEVVAGEATERQALVTGDAVNVAARLEQAASPGEILIGEPTFRLVRDAVTVEPVAPLELKGKSEPMAAYRLTTVRDVTPARRHRLDTPLVGREDELELLRSRLTAAQAGRAIVATVVGEPGVGKSRLAGELIASAQADFRILSGRCLPYGEGITYWPIAEIVHQAAGIHDEHSRDEAASRIERLHPGREAQVIAQAIGLADGEAATDEIASAVVGLVRSLASERPLLLFVDDIHWAEAGLLELVSSLSERARDVPLLVLCLARPELLEEQPRWEATVRLRPLEPAESATLVERLLGTANLPAGLGDRIAEAAAGNPLFTEELVGMLIDEGLLERSNGAWTADPGLADFHVPLTLRELLGARLDRMSQGERSALERGAIEGQVFHRGAVAALSDDPEPDVADALELLVEREYLRPARAEFVDDAAFRVRHILIRDAAYDGIPKKLRARLHERFADWLERKAGAREVEYEEILGYHLEQAFSYLEELGPVDDVGRALARRAADRLGSSGRRAFARHDGAAIPLLTRAAALLPRGDETRLDHLASASEAIAYAERPEQRAFASDVAAEATEFGLARVAAHARLLVAWIDLNSDTDYGAARFLAETDELEAIYQDHADADGLTKIEDARAYIHDMRRHSAAVERAAERGVAHARRAGNRRRELEMVWWLLWQQSQGPRPVEEALERCVALRAECDGNLAAEAAYLETVAELEAMRGRLDVARRLAHESADIRAELSLHGLRVRTILTCGEIELLAGDLASAESILRRNLSEVPDTHAWVVSWGGSLLAEVLLAQDRLDEAMELTRLAEDAALPDLAVAQIRWRCARAKILARRGDGEAEALARDAVDRAAETDDLTLQGLAFEALATAHAAAGNADHAAQAADAALERYERKGNVAAAKRTRALVAEWDTAG